MSNAIASRPARQQTRKPRPKPIRTIRLMVSHSPLNTGVVRIAVNGKEQDYMVDEVEGCSFGRGFILSKIGREQQYHLNIDRDRRTCECEGHITHGHCKHADGLAALINANRL